MQCNSKGIEAIRRRLKNELDKEGPREIPAASTLREFPAHWRETKKSIRREAMSHSLKRIGQNIFSEN